MNRCDLTTKTFYRSHIGHTVRRTSSWNGQLGSVQVQGNPTRRRTGSSSDERDDRFPIYHLQHRAYCRNNTTGQTDADHDHEDIPREQKSQRNSSEDGTLACHRPTNNDPDDRLSK